MIDRAMGTAPGQVGILAIVLAVALFLPNLAVAVRRSHDTSRSGWWIFIGLIPLVGAIILIVCLAQDSHGDNAYGPSPKAIGAGEVPVLN